MHTAEGIHDLLGLTLPIGKCLGDLAGACDKRDDLNNFIVGTEDFLCRDEHEILRLHCYGR